MEFENLHSKRDMLHISYETAIAIIDKLIISKLSNEPNRLEAHKRVKSLLLTEIGLYCTDPMLRFYDLHIKESFLFVEDEKKWMLAKIKYGI